ncbi:hypothetical protein DBL03_20495, partial [Pseudomonas putida]
ATLNGGWKLASRPGPFAGEPAPTTACARVGAGKPANTVAAATVIGRWKVASSPGPFAMNPRLQGIA